MVRGFHPFSHMTSRTRGHVKSSKKLKTFTAMLMVTKLDWLVAYNEKFPPIKLHDPLITRNCPVMRQIKKVLSAHPEDQWLLN